MKVKGLNHSSIKTRNLIRSEFANMISEKKELSKITVTELVNNIDINRGTFYSHYSNIYEIAKEFQDEALDLFNDDITSLNDVNDFIDNINDFLKTNCNLYQAILKANDPMIFMERLNRMANKKLNDILKSKTNDKYLELNISVFVDGLINLYIKYFRDEISFSLEEINDYSKKLFNVMFISSESVFFSSWFSYLFSFSIHLSHFKAILIYFTPFSNIDHLIISLSFDYYNFTSKKYQRICWYFFY